jgi:hypothetical protein
MGAIPPPWAMIACGRKGAGSVGDLRASHIGVAGLEEVAVMSRNDQRIDRPLLLEWIVLGRPDLTRPGRGGRIRAVLCEALPPSRSAPHRRPSLWLPR